MGVIYSVKIELEEPLTIGMNQMVGNQVDACDFIPSTVLRGAIASALVSKGKRDRLPLLFGGAFPRWSPCWPDGGTEHFTIPMPLSFFRNKDDAGFNGEFGVINALQAEIPYDQKTMDSFCNTIERDTFCPERFQWDRLAPGWLSVPGNDASKSNQSAVSLVNIMHTAMNYNTQSARQGALFSRTAVAENTIFWSYVLDPDEVIINEDKVEEVFLGKRRSAGNGLAGITWEMSVQVPFMTKPAPGAHEVNIQFLSPTIVPGPNGGYLTGFDDEAWKALLGTEVQTIKAFSASFLVRGWSMSWDLPRERMPGIAAGSCYRLRSKGDAHEFTETLGRLVEKGVGLRTGEGFGWISVNPPWLDPLFFDGDAKLADPLKIETTSEAEIPTGWPVAWKNQRLIERAAELAKAAAELKEVGANKFKELEIVAARLPSLDELTSYLKSRSERPNPRGWKEVGDILSQKYFNEKPQLEEARCVMAWVYAFLASNERT
ncbi:MAG: hypothetical protein AAGU11_07155 [Syntrophobacteraceae bacterium]